VTGTSPSEDQVLPLRDRLPDYLATFGVGWVAILGLGVAIGLFSAASLIEGIAYVAMGTGVILLLAGGASGGGYTNMGLGAAGALFGSRQRPDDDFDDPDVRRGLLRRVNAEERLRKGLRPESNPRAFWQVIAGFVNLTVAFSLLMIFGG
jgi:hypothetical protein